MKRFLSAILVLVLVSTTFLLSGCGASLGGGLKSYVDTSGGFQFLYPNGWVPVKSSSVAVAFHDLIEPSENVSVVISEVGDRKSLAELGSPGEVGYQLADRAIAPPGSNRTADLLTANTRQVDNKTYYILEYAVTLPDKKRHNLASVVISRGKLLTFNASTTEQRWPKVETLIRSAVNSFTAY